MPGIEPVSHVIDPQRRTPVACEVGVLLCGGSVARTWWAGSPARCLGVLARFLDEHGA